MTYVGSGSTATINLVASKRSHTISGLTPGAQYDVELIGSNGNGTGDVAYAAAVSAGTLTQAEYTRALSDTKAPAISGGMAIRSTVRLDFDEDLDLGSVPEGSAFSVFVRHGGSGGPTRTLNGTGAIETSSDAPSALRVTLDGSIVNDDAVYVSYTKPEQNALADAAGNAVNSFSRYRVRNFTPRDFSDRWAPTVNSAEVSEMTLLVNFNENLDTKSVPAADAFRVTATTRGGVTRTILGSGTVRTGENRWVSSSRAVYVANNVANVRLRSKVFRGETVTVSYTKPDQKPLQDNAGNAVATFTGRSVTNNTPFEATRAWVNSNEQKYNQVVLEFDKALNSASVPPASAFSVKWKHSVDLETTYNVTGTPAISGSTVTLNVNGKLFVGFGFKVTYTKPSSGNQLRDTEGTEVQSFTFTQPGAASHVTCSDGGYWILIKGGAISSLSDVPCDMAKPAWNFGGTGDGSIEWVYNKANPEPPANQPVASVIYTQPGQPNHRAVRGDDNNCYREERVRGKWLRSVSYGASDDACRNASWNVYNRWKEGRAMVNPDGGTFPDRPAPIQLLSTKLTLGQYPDSTAIGCDDYDSQIRCRNLATKTNFDSIWGALYRFDGFYYDTACPVDDSPVQGNPCTVRIYFNNPVPWGLSLHIGNLELRYADGNPIPYYYGHKYYNAPRNWTAGTEVSLTLTVPATMAPAPMLQTATVSGSELYMTFDRYMDTASKPAPGDFYVTVNGSRRNVADDGVAIAGLQVTLTLASAVSGGDTVKVRYTKPDQNPLRSFDRSDVETFADQDVSNLTSDASSDSDPSDSDPTDGSDDGGSGDNGDNPPAVVSDPPSEHSNLLGTQATPTVTGVKVSSSPASGDTYLLGETISVTLTFSEKVDVTGSPRLKIDMDPADWGEKTASYSGGTGTASLTFTHTVVQPNYSTQGIAVLADSLALNGGTIKSSSSQADAALSHIRLNHNASHKVDWQRSPPAPTVTGVRVSSSPASGDTYLLGETIQVTLTFSENVTVTGSPRLKIDMDPADWGEKWASYSERQRHGKPHLLPHGGGAELLHARHSGAGELACAQRRHNKVVVNAGERGAVAH